MSQYSTGGEMEKKCKTCAHWDRWEETKGDFCIGSVLFVYGTLY